MCARKRICSPPTPSFRNNKNVELKVRNYGGLVEFVRVVHMGKNRQGLSTEALKVFKIYFKLYNQDSVNSVIQTTKNRVEMHLQF